MIRSRWKEVEIDHFNISIVWAVLILTRFNKVVILASSHYIILFSLNLFLFANSQEMPKKILTFKSNVSMSIEDNF
jgi:hypothetical protein